MPAPIIGGLRSFIEQNTNSIYWDGEVPRYDLSGNPVYPETPSLPPGETLPWPVFRLLMTEPGFRRTWTFEWAYDDEGDIHIEIWGTTRAQEEQVLSQVEALFALETNWPKVQLAGLPRNKNYLISMIFQSWYSGQEEGVRGPQSELLYKGLIIYQCRVHGAVITRYN